MGLVDSFRRYIRGEDYDDEGYDDFVEADPEPQKKWPAFDAAAEREDRSERMSDTRARRFFHDPQQPGCEYSYGNAAFRGARKAGEI